MARYLLRRVGTALVALFVLSVVAFLLAEVIPGDPARTYAGPGATPASIAAARVHLGLNHSLVVQYWTYLGRLVQGNFGISVFTHRPIAQDLATALPPSIELVVVAMALNVFVGVPLGVIAAARPGGLVDGFTRLVAMIGIGVPAFFLAILLQYVFAYRLGVLPLTGEVGTNVNLGASITGFPLIDTLLHGNFPAFGSLVEHLLLPAVALAAGFSGVIMRTVRSSMLGTLGEEYVVLARAKGLRESRVLVGHALRNALLPSLTILGMQVGWMLGSTILVESVYSYPGIGAYAVTALFESDLWAVVAVVFVIGAVFVVANFLTDVVQMLVDPEVRARRLGATA